MILNAVYSLLINHAGLSGLVQNRVYPVSAPQGVAFPYVVMHLIDTNHHEVLLGSAGFARSVIQFNSYCLYQFELVAPIAEQIRHAVQGFHGIAAGIEIDGANMITERSNYIPSPSGADPGVYEIQTDIAFWHVESVPVFS